MEVVIRSKSVDLKHKFVLVPLAYNKDTCHRDQTEMNVERGMDQQPIVGQSFSKFMEYNNLVNDDVKEFYPLSYKQLADPNALLAIKTVESKTNIYGKDYNTVRYMMRKGNHPRDPSRMHDSIRQDYFVSLVKWVKDNYERDTLQQMATLKIQSKKAISRGIPYYI